MKPNLQMILPVAIGALLIVICSIFQGVWTGRWGAGASADVVAFTEAFQRIPLVIGERWRGEDNPEMDDLEREAAGAAGYLTRNYHNDETGEVVSVYMICGASRDVAIHTPDKCYPGAGFRMEDKIRRHRIETERSAAEFFTSVFLRQEPDRSQRLRIFWAWNADGKWEAPRWPRWKYGRRALSKIYLTAPTSEGQSADDNPCPEFAQLFLPEVDRLLFPGQTSDSSTAAEAGADTASADG